MIERRGGRRRDELVLVFSLPSAFGSVSVVGDFNNWDPAATPMVCAGDIVTASVIVAVGKPCRFRYLDTNDRHFNDETADRFVERETGGYVSEVDTTLDQTRLATHASSHSEVGTRGTKRGNISRSIEPSLPTRADDSMSDSSA